MPWHGVRLPVFPFVVLCWGLYRENHMPFSRFVTLFLALGAPLSAVDRTRILDQYAQLPLSFEPNIGQTDSRFQFLARSAGYTMLLGPSEAVMVLASRATKDAIVL